MNVGTAKIWGSETMQLARVGDASAPSKLGVAAELHGAIGHVGRDAELPGDTFTKLLFAARDGHAEAISLARGGAGPDALAERFAGVRDTLTAAVHVGDLGNAYAPAATGAARDAAAELSTLLASGAPEGALTNAALHTAASIDVATHQLGLDRALGRLDGLVSG